MGHKTLINGTAYEISGGKTLINGTGYEIANGRTLVGGTGYDIAFLPAIGDLSVGSSVYLNVNGARREFLIVQQGLPSSRYDASCNGTWLLMKDLYELRAWNSTENNDYKSSEIHKYLNGLFLGLFESKVQSCIKQVKIPYCNGAGGSFTLEYGSNGLSTKIFLLAGREVGVDSNWSIPDDASPLSYFSSMNANNIRDEAGRVAYYNGSSKYWWLRSPHARYEHTACNVTGKGWVSTTGTTSSDGIRPSLILPSGTVYDESLNIIV